MRKDILIAYYSHSSNTRKLAKQIEQQTGGVVHEIVPQNAYPNDYHAVVEQAKTEIRAGFHPELMEQNVDITKYNVLFIGTPNWWSTMAPPIATFLEKHCESSGKTIIPFCTHGGGGAGHIEDDIKKLCPNAIVVPMLSIYGDSVIPAQVEAWLRKNSFELS